MELHKLIHGVCESAKHWHLPFLFGMAGFISIAPKADSLCNISDLGEVPGDNILPKEILISLSSRRGL